MTDEQMLTHDTATVNLLANSRRVILVTMHLHTEEKLPLEVAMQVVQTAAILQTKEGGNHNG